MMISQETESIQLDEMNSLQNVEETLVLKKIMEQMKDGRNLSDKNEVQYILCIHVIIIFFHDQINALG